MRPSESAVARDIDEKLRLFDNEIPLPGINLQENRICLVEQIIDSIRRIKYVTTIRDSNNISFLRADATNIMFDPIRAAVWHKNQGNIDEAFWLVFLFVHFGKNLKTGWNLIRDIYGALGSPMRWDWERITSNLEEFLFWLDDNQVTIKNNGNFGNHRKYQSLDAFSSRGTGATIRTYIDWVGSQHDHQLKIGDVVSRGSNDSKAAFHALYRSMDEVMGFGRTGRFDYLTMIGKLGLADITPGSTYMQGATGPLAGARLLFGGSIDADLNRSTINMLLLELETHLNLYFGMQVLEDALCNWQKKPNQYVHFKG